MARAINVFDLEPGGIERRRGGFYRNILDVPYITDPAGTLVKSGPRKGLVLRLPYGSPSNFAKLIENTFNLQKWGERRAVLGIGIDPHLHADCIRLAQLDVDSDAYKAEADRIVIAAKAAAETNLAADRGTHGHAITEDDDEGRDWLQRAEAGELLGIPTEAQRALVQSWRDMLVREGLEILTSEASCVDDHWHLAGTLDNLARLSRTLRFRLCTGEIREIPAGTVVVLDKKTGQRRTNAQGVVQYWHGYAVQIASYAQSQVYNTETEQRSAWPWTIDQTHALIAHLDVLGAINGTPSCELVYVDLVAGREHGGATVVTAKQWGKRPDVFSVAQLSDQLDLTRAPATPTAVEHEPAAGEGAPPAPEPAADPFDGLADSVATHPAARGLVAKPEFKLNPKPLEPLEQRPRIPLVQKQQAMIAKRPVPAEGPACDEAAVAALERQYTRLGPERRPWVDTLAAEAVQAGVGFGLRHTRTVRRFEIMRAIVQLAEQPDDDFVRALLAITLGDLAHFPAIPLGRLIGTLDADEAIRFAATVDRYMQGVFVAYIDESTPDQLLRLHSVDA